MHIRVSRRNLRYTVTEATPKPGTSNALGTVRVINAFVATRWSEQIRDWRQCVSERAHAAGCEDDIVSACAWDRRKHEPRGGAEYYPLRQQIERECRTTDFVTPKEISHRLIRIYPYITICSLAVASVCTIALTRYGMHEICRNVCMSILDLFQCWEGKLYPLS